MQAAVFHGREDVRVEDHPEPDVGADDVKVEVAACGICGSDLHEYAAGPIFIPDEEPHPVSGDSLPVPMGHEFAGEVVEAGDDVTEVAVGDRVAVNPVLWCGDCRYCEAGQYHLCESNGFVGLSGGGGGFAEYVSVHEDQAVPLPEEVSLDHGALVEPFSVGLHAARNSDFDAGDDVVVFGAGPIGLAVVQAVDAAGASDVYVVEPQDARRNRAAEQGADVTLDPTDEDVLDVVDEATDGGADATFEVAGVGQTVRDAVSAAKHDGSVTIVSIFEDTVEFDPNEVVLGERSITGTLAYEGGPRSHVEYEAVIDLFADGDLDPEAIVTDRIDLADVVDEGFEALLADDADDVKILVEP